MNILPHKSWHVRTKKNIARVRKDEAKAAEEEKELQRKISLAAQEARTDFLRERAKQRVDHDTAVAEEDEEIPKLPVKEEISLVGKGGHVNFFQEIEDGVIQKCKVNLEHEEEKKAEQEDYEKKIGYLTYLGQNSLEQTKEKPWYAKLDRRPIGVTSTKSETTTTTKSEKEDDLSKLKETKFKDFHDPLKNIRKYLKTPGVKNRIENVNKSSSSSSSLVRKRKLSADAVNDNSSKSSISRHSPKKNKKSKKAKKEKKKTKHHSSKHKHVKKEKQRLRSSEEGSTDSDDEEEREKQQKLAKLRAERLEREREERRKAERLMTKLRGEPIEEEKPPTNISSSSHDNGIRVKQKYNSQFNPHLARQNFDN